MDKLIAVLAALMLLSPLTWAEDNIATLRGTPLNEEATPPTMAVVDNRDIKQIRNYPMQPPTTPHTVRNYRVDIYSNKCLSCHSRKQTGQSQAPMVSVTHYMDRDGNFLADVSPRRYFCDQCHVTQTDAPALVGNDFMDIDQLLREAQ